jgi:hypothetical protein
MWGSMKYQVILGRGEQSPPLEDVRGNEPEGLITPGGVAPCYYVRPLQGQETPHE